MTCVINTQIDEISLSVLGGIRPRKGKTLAIMQVCGCSQSFNAVNQMLIRVRWMRMVTIPNQSSIPKAWLEFNSKARLSEGPFYSRIVDVMEELTQFTCLMRGRSKYLVDRYSERVETVDETNNRVSQKYIIQPWRCTTTDPTEYPAPKEQIRP